MEPLNNISEVPQNPLLKVTPLSKYLALILFIAMPFIGGWIGYNYAPEKIVTIDNVVIKEVIKEVIVDKPLPSEFRTFTNNEHGISISFPDTFSVSDGVEDFSHTSSDATFIPNAEYFSYCDGKKMVDGARTCDGPQYTLGIQLHDYVVTQELIDSWGGEVVSSAQVTINGRPAWSITLGGATGESQSLNFDYSGGTLGVIFYSDFYDYKAPPLFITEEAREILDTLRF